jgi:hypothetical protein
VCEAGSSATRKRTGGDPATACSVIRGRGPAGEGFVGGEAPQRPGLELTGLGLGDLDLARGLAQAPRLAAAGAEAGDDDAPLVLGQLRERLLHSLLLLALEHLLLEVGGALSDQLAERGVVLAHGLVEARGDPRQVADRHDVLERQLGLLRHLLVGGGAVQLGRELRGDPVHGALTLRDVRRDPHRAARVVQPALDRLLDPQHRVGGELVAASPVELLRRADQAQHRLLNEVAHVEAVALVAACKLDHQPQVGVDQALLGGEVAALDRLRKLDLLLLREQGVLHRLVDEQLQAVGGVLGHLVLARAPLSRARAGGPGLVVVLAAHTASLAALVRSPSIARHLAPSSVVRPLPRSIQLGPRTSPVLHKV